MAISKAKDKRFWDRIAPRYSTQPITDVAAYEKKLDLTRAFFTPDMRILEFGCGTGGTAIRHAPFVAHVTALDVSDAMIAIARDRAAEAGVANVDFQPADFEAYDAPDRSFDAVLGMNVLHLLPNWREAIAKAFRLLKPGGTFFSSTACRADSHAFMAPILPVGRWLGRFPYVDVFSQAALAREMEDAGFRLVQQWRPGKGKAVFMVAGKPAATDTTTAAQSVAQMPG